ncbi:MAG: YceI family protein [Reichenbachiella sp.]
MLYTIFTLLMLTFTSEENTTSSSINAAESSIVWTATKITGSHTGNIQISNGSLNFEGDQLIGGEFTADMTSINTTDLEGEWKDKLDGHLKSDDFFGVEKFPTSTFKITSVKLKEGSTYQITGDFTIKGISQTVTFPAEVDAAAKSAVATVTLDRTKFNVRYGSSSFFDNLGDKAISDEFTLGIKIVSE